MKLTNARLGVSIDVRLSAVELAPISGASPLPAYVEADRRWNGWAIPYFTREQADALANEMAELIGDDGKMEYFPATDTYVVTQDQSDPEEFPGEDWRDEQGKTLWLYAIGACCWIWDEVEEPAEPEAMPKPMKHVLRIVGANWNRPARVTIHESEEAAKAALVAYVKLNWADEVGGMEGYEEIPEDADQMVDEYFEAVDEEVYTIEAVTGR